MARELQGDYARPLKFWQGDFYEWTGTHWSIVDIGRVRTFVRLATERAYYLVKDNTGDLKPKDWSPTKDKVAEVVAALGEAVVPFHGKQDDCMALENCVLDVATRTAKEHHASRFNLSSLPFRYDPDAECPQWLAFLESTLGDDQQSVQLIRQWFGYVLSGRKDLHKILAMVGPRRCGKGTIASVLQAMVGDEGWAAPILGQLARPFGTQGLIGKRLAVLGDVRWAGKETQAAVPILLALGSEDGMSINRKNREDWIGRLGVRVMMMSNDIPSFRDTSGALAGRLLLVEFTKSFYGKEDLALLPRLLTELPGILNWALDGLDDLNAGGAFTEPSSAHEARDEMQRDSSPVAAWGEDWCEIVPGHETALETLFADYRTWCGNQNIDHEGTLQRFARDLRSALGAQGVTTIRPTRGGKKVALVVGLRRIPGASIQVAQ